MEQALHVERKDRVLVVRLARPAKRNALSDSLVGELERAFSTVPEGVGAAVIHGEGDHFSAGLDLSELTERDAFEGVMHSRMWHRALERVQFGAVPVVAALHGAVIGGGLELAAACHIRVAEPSAYYALPEGRRGIFVGGGGSARLPRLVGTALVTDMMMTGRVIGAAEGQPLGFSQYVLEAVLREDGDGALRRQLALDQRLRDAEDAVARFPVGERAPLAVAAAPGEKGSVGRVLCPVQQLLGEPLRIRRQRHARAQDHGAVGAYFAIDVDVPHGDRAVRSTHPFTLSARFSRKSRSRCFASGALCAMAAVSASIMRPWSWPTSAMRGSTCISA